MAISLSKTLDSKPLEILRSNQDIYVGSVSQVQRCFDALTEEHITPDTLHIIGFDIDQIWEQTKHFLEAVSIATFASDTRVHFNFESTEGPPKKRTQVSNEKSSQVPHAIPCHDDMKTITTEPETESLSPRRPKARGSNHSIDIEDNEKQFHRDGIPLLKPEHSDHAGFHENKYSTKELDDGFFQLDKFNLATKSFEQADEMGDTPTGFDLSINWHADPGEQLDYSNSSDSDITGIRIDPMYSDFFLSPNDLAELPQANSEAIRPESQNLTRKSDDTGAASDLVDIMESLRNDLFRGSNESNFEREVDSESDGISFIYATQSSSYKQGQAQLDDQIRTLEKQNIEQREWVLSGEVDSQHRPFDSLLQEDLEFERIGQPVPVITQTTTASLEDMVKARILRNNFDEIQRRSLASRHTRTLTLVPELDDSKPRNSLVETYMGVEGKDSVEQINNPNSKSKVLKTEIRELFVNIDHQLDMLSSKHFVPKNPNATISSIPDTRVVHFEEITLGTGHSLTSGLSTLAPQEIYDPSSTSYQSYGSTKVSGIPISSHEISYSKRTKEMGQRKRREKSKSKSDSNSKSGELLNSLQRGGVSLIKDDGHRVYISGSRERGKDTLSSSHVKL
ncbi:hypothetical protein AA313_de0200578 [Arthrobotrys entomopaga]|nr:hypothetical protein AA313_de0200578 [Arthrobotrys entomopaga]